MDIGFNIKRFRELRNLTRERIAAELDMSVSGYSRIERNEIDLTLSRIRKIAQVLGVEMSQILNFDADQVLNTRHGQANAERSHGGENQATGKELYAEKYIKVLEAENERLKREGMNKDQQETGNGKKQRDRK